MKKIILKSVALALAVSFTVQEFSWAAPVLTAVAFQNPFLSGDKIRIPEAFGSVRESFQGETPRLLVHIQDAHNNFGAQDNISNILEDLIAHHGIHTVFLEGGTKDDSLDFLRPLAPAAQRKKVARKYLLKGEINGAEYLDLSTDHEMSLTGVEDPVLYFKNLKTYGAVVKDRERTLSYLDELSKRVETLKRRMYPAQLVALDGLIRAFDKNNESFTEYYDALGDAARQSGVSLLGYPHFLSLGQLKAFESSIDFKKANEEQEEICRLLRRSGWTDKDFFTPKRAGAGFQDLLYFYRGLLENAVQRGFDRKDCPDLLQYLDYLKRVGTIRPEALNRETRAIQAEIYGRSLQGEGRRLYEIDEAVLNLKKLFSMQAEKKDFEAYLGRKAEPRFHTLAMLAFLNKKLLDLGNDADALPYETVLEERKKDIEDFYRTTADRDEVMVQKTLRAMEEKHISSAVIITGGYHTENLTGLLRRAKVSYVVVSPNIRQETNLKRYEEGLLSELGRENPLENAAKLVISGDQKFLARLLAAERVYGGFVPRFRAEFGATGVSPIAVTPQAPAAARMAEPKLVVVSGLRAEGFKGRKLFFTLRTAGEQIWKGELVRTKEPGIGERLLPQLSRSALGWLWFPRLGRTTREWVLTLYRPDHSKYRQMYFLKNEADAASALPILELLASDADVRTEWNDHRAHWRSVIDFLPEVTQRRIAQAAPFSMDAAKRLRWLDIVADRVYEELSPAERRTIAEFELKDILRANDLIYGRMWHAILENKGFLELMPGDVAGLFRAVALRARQDEGMVWTADDDQELQWIMPELLAELTSRGVDEPALVGSRLTASNWIKRALLVTALWVAVLPLAGNLTAAQTLSPVAPSPAPVQRIQEPQAPARGPDLVQTQADAGTQKLIATLNKSLRKPSPKSKNYRQKIAKFRQDVHAQKNAIRKLLAGKISADELASMGDNNFFTPQTAKLKKMALSEIQQSKKTVEVRSALSRERTVSRGGSNSVTVRPSTVIRSAVQDKAGSLDRDSSVAPGGSGSLAPGGAGPGGGNPPPPKPTLAVPPVQAAAAVPATVSKNAAEEARRKKLRLSAFERRELWDSFTNFQQSVQGLRDGDVSPRDLTSALSQFYERASGEGSGAVGEWLSAQAVQFRQEFYNTPHRNFGEDILDRWIVVLNGVRPRLAKQLNIPDKNTVSDHPVAVARATLPVPPPAKTKPPETASSAVPPRTGNSKTTPRTDSDLFKVDPYQNNGGYQAETELPLTERIAIVWSDLKDFVRHPAQHLGSIVFGSLLFLLTGFGVYAFRYAMRRKVYRRWHAPPVSSEEKETNLADLLRRLQELQEMSEEFQQEFSGHADAIGRIESGLKEAREAIADAVKQRSAAALENPTLTLAKLQDPFTALKSAQAVLREKVESFKELDLIPMLRMYNQLVSGSELPKGERTVLFRKESELLSSRTKELSEKLAREIEKTDQASEVWNTSRQDAAALEKTLKLYQVLRQAADVAIRKIESRPDDKTLKAAEALRAGLFEFVSQVADDLSWYLEHWKNSDRPNILWQMRESLRRFETKGEDWRAALNEFLAAVPEVSKPAASPGEQFKYLYDFQLGQDGDWSTVLKGYLGGGEGDAAFEREFWAMMREALQSSSTPVFVEPFLIQNNGDNGKNGNKSNGHRSGKSHEELKARIEAIFGPAGEGATVTGIQLHDTRPVFQPAFSGAEDGSAVTRNPLPALEIPQEFAFIRQPGWKKKSGGNGSNGNGGSGHGARLAAVETALVNLSDPGPAADIPMIHDGLEVDGKLSADERRAIAKIALIHRENTRKLRDLVIKGKQIDFGSGWASWRFAERLAVIALDNLGARTQDIRSIGYGSKTDNWVTYIRLNSGRYVVLEPSSAEEPIRSHTKVWTARTPGELLQKISSHYQVEPSLWKTWEQMFNEGSSTRISDLVTRQISAEKAREAAGDLAVGDKVFFKDRGWYGRFEGVDDEEGFLVVRFENGRTSRLVKSQLEKLPSGARLSAVEATLVNAPSFQPQFISKSSIRMGLDLNAIESALAEKNMTSEQKNLYKSQIDFLIDMYYLNSKLAPVRSPRRTDYLVGFLLPTLVRAYSPEEFSKHLKLLAYFVAAGDIWHELGKLGYPEDRQTLLNLWASAPASYRQYLKEGPFDFPEEPLSSFKEWQSTKRQRAKQAGDFNENWTLTSLDLFHLLERANQSDILLDKGSSRLVEIPEEARRERRVNLESLFRAQWLSAERVRFFAELTNALVDQWALNPQKSMASVSLHGRESVAGIYWHLALAHHMNEDIDGDLAIVYLTLQKFFDRFELAQHSVWADEILGLHGFHAPGMSPSLDYSRVSTDLRTEAIETDDDLSIEQVLERLDILMNTLKFNNDGTIARNDRPEKLLAQVTKWLLRLEEERTRLSSKTAIEISANLNRAIQRIPPQPNYGRSYGGSPRKWALYGPPKAKSKLGAITILAKRSGVSKETIYNILKGADGKSTIPKIQRKLEKALENMGYAEPDGLAPSRLEEERISEEILNARRLYALLLMIVVDAYELGGAKQLMSQLTEAGSFEGPTIFPVDILHGLNSDRMQKFTRAIEALTAGKAPSPVYRSKAIERQMRALRPFWKPTRRASLKKPSETEPMIGSYDDINRSVWRNGEREVVASKETAPDRILSVTRLEWDIVNFLSQHLANAASVHWLEKIYMSRNPEELIEIISEKTGWTVEELRTVVDALQAHLVKRGWLRVKDAAEEAPSEVYSIMNTETDTERLLNFERDAVELESDHLADEWLRQHASLAAQNPIQTSATAGARLAVPHQELRSELESIVQGWLSLSENSNGSRTLLERRLREFNEKNYEIPVSPKRYFSFRAEQHVSISLHFPRPLFIQESESSGQSRLSTREAEIHLRAYLEGLDLKFQIVKRGRSTPYQYSFDKTTKSKYQKVRNDTSRIQKFMQLNPLNENGRISESDILPFRSKLEADLYTAYPEAREHSGRFQETFEELVPFTVREYSLYGKQVNAQLYTFLKKNLVRFYRSKYLEQRRYVIEWRHFDPIYDQLVSYARKRVTLKNYSSFDLNNGGQPVESPEEIVHQALLGIMKPGVTVPFSPDNAQLTKEHVLGAINNILRTRRNQELERPAVIPFESEADGQEGEEARIPDDFSLSEHLERRSEIMHMRSLVKNLPEPFKSILWMLDFMDMRQIHVAQSISMSDSWISDIAYPLALQILKAAYAGEPYMTDQIRRIANKWNRRQWPAEKGNEGAKRELWTLYDAAHDFLQQGLENDHALQGLRSAIVSFNVKKIKVWSSRSGVLILNRRRKIKFGRLIPDRVYTVKASLNADNEVVFRMTAADGSEARYRWARADILDGTKTTITARRPLTFVPGNHRPEFVKIYSLAERFYAKEKAAGEKGIAKELNALKNGVAEFADKKIIVQSSKSGMFGFEFQGRKVHFAHLLGDHSYTVKVSLNADNEVIFRMTAVDGSQVRLRWDRKDIMEKRTRVWARVYDYRADFQKLYSLAIAYYEERFLSSQKIQALLDFYKQNKMSIRANPSGAFTFHSLDGRNVRFSGLLGGRWYTAEPSLNADDEIVFLMTAADGSETRFRWDRNAVLDANKPNIESRLVSRSKGTEKRKTSEAPGAVSGQAWTVIPTRPAPIELPAGARLSAASKLSFKEAELAVQDLQGAIDQLEKAKKTFAMVDEIPDVIRDAARIRSLILRDRMPMPTNLLDQLARRITREFPYLSVVRLHMRNAQKHLQAAELLYRASGAKKGSNAPSAAEPRHGIELAKGDLRSAAGFLQQALTVSYLDELPGSSKGTLREEIYFVIVGIDRFYRALNRPFSWDWYRKWAKNPLVGMEIRAGQWLKDQGKEPSDFPYLTQALNALRSSAHHLVGRNAGTAQPRGARLANRTPEGQQIVEIVFQSLRSSLTSKVPGSELDQTTSFYGLMKAYLKSVPHLNGDYEKAWGFVEEAAGRALQEAKAAVVVQNFLTESDIKRIKPAALKTMKERATIAAFIKPINSLILKVDEKWAGARPVSTATIVPEPKADLDVEAALNMLQGAVRELEAAQGVEESLLAEIPPATDSKYGSAGTFKAELRRAIHRLQGVSKPVKRGDREDAAFALQGPIGQLQDMQRRVDIAKKADVFPYVARAMEQAKALLLNLESQAHPTAARLAAEDSILSPDGNLKAVLEQNPLFTDRVVRLLGKTEQGKYEKDLGIIRVAMSYGPNEFVFTPDSKGIVLDRMYDHDFVIYDISERDESNNGKVILKVSKIISFERPMVVRKMAFLPDFPNVLAVVTDSDQVRQVLSLDVSSEKWIARIDLPSRLQHAVKYSILTVSDGLMLEGSNLNNDSIGRVRLSSQELVQAGARLAVQSAVAPVPFTARVRSKNPLISRPVVPAPVDTVVASSPEARGDTDIRSIGSRLALSMRSLRGKVLIPVLAATVIVLFALSPVQNAQAANIQVEAIQVEDLDRLTGPVLYTGMVNPKNTRGTLKRSTVPSDIEVDRNAEKISDQNLLFALSEVQTQGQIDADLEISLSLLSQLKDPDQFRVQFTDLVRSMVQFRRSAFGRRGEFYLTDSGALSEVQIAIATGAAEKFGDFVHFSRTSSGKPSARFSDPELENPSGEDGKLHFPVTRIDANSVAGWFGEFAIAMKTAQYYARNGKLDTARIDASDVPDGFLDAYGLRAVERPDKRIFADIITYRAKEATLVHFRWKPIAAYPWEQILKVLNGARLSILGAA